MTYRILSFDGGGVRGQCVTTILRRLEEALPGWIEEANLFTGASIGAVLALGLASGHKADQLDDMFHKYGPLLFQPAKPIIPTILTRFFRAGYSTDPLNRLLDEFCGDSLLGNLKKRVIVPTLKLDNEERDPSIRRWQPTIFHNFGGNNDDLGQIPVREVIMRATATPTIFPSADGYIDGGIVANNPSMIALAHMQEKRYRIRSHSGDQELVLLSIGTGYKPKHIEGKRKDWGFIQWQKYMIDMMNNGNMQLVDSQCRQFLGEAYHRLCPALPEKIHAFDKRKLGRLVALAESIDLSQTISWLKAHWLADRPGSQAKPAPSLATPAP